MSGVTRTDALVLGGDLEALVAALVLARAGRRVALLCERPRPGGLHGSEEFAPGCETRGTVHDDDRFPDELARDLDLARHGLAFEDAPSPIALDTRGGRVVLEPSADSPFGASTDAHRDFLAAELRREPPDLDPAGLSGALDLSARGNALRALGGASLHELLWRLPTSVADRLGDLVDDPLRRAAYAADALAGTWVGPRAAGTTALALLRDAARGARPRRPQGGSPALVRALLAALRERGVRVHCGKPIVGLIVSGARSAARARGAWLSDGSEFRADAVLSALDPRRTLEDLAPREALDEEARDALAPLRARGTIAVLDLAFADDPPAGAPSGVLRVLDDCDHLEQCADAVKHGHLAERPWLEAHPHRNADGKACWTVHLHGVPHDFAADGDEAQRGALTDRALDLLDAALPGARFAVTARRLRTPRDLARAHALAGGHLWQAELALDQLSLLRPTCDLAGYLAPVDGLFLGSTAQHPGGLQPGRCGALASAALLRRS